MSTLRKITLFMSRIQQQPFSLARQQSLCWMMTKKLDSQGFLITRNNSGTCEASPLVPRRVFSPFIMSVSDRVKSAMITKEPNIRHADCEYTIKFIRDALLRVVKVTPEDYSAVPINGNSALAIEGAIRTMLVHKKGKMVVIESGDQANRIEIICQSKGISVTKIPADPAKIRDTLIRDKNIAGVAAVHCEPFSGIVNPVDKIGELVKKIIPDAFYFVDASMTFGAMPIDMGNVDFLISSSSKCLQAAPGLAFVIAKRNLLDMHKYHGDSLVMDLTAQHDELEKSGRFRFTPPVHVMNALKEALLELPDEGGVQGRAKRYYENNALLKRGMAAIGFHQVYSDQQNPMGYLTTAFAFPKNPLFVFEEFRNRLNDYGFLICDNPNSKKAFCIANIGNLNQDDIENLLHNIRQVCYDMRICVPITEMFS